MNTNSSSTCIFPMRKQKSHRSGSSYMQKGAALYCPSLNCTSRLVQGILGQEPEGSGGCWSLTLNPLSLMDEPASRWTLCINNAILLASAMNHSYTLYTFMHAHSIADRFSMYLYSYACIKRVHGSYLEMSSDAVETCRTGQTQWKMLLTLADYGQCLSCLDLSLPMWSAVSAN